MIKVDEIFGYEQLEKKVKARLIADSQAEVAEGTITNMPSGYDLAFGSYVITADFHVGILKSDGTWGWDAEEDTRSVSPVLNTGLKSAVDNDLRRDTVEPIDEIPEEEEEPKDDMR